MILEHSADYYREIVNGVARHAATEALKVIEKEVAGAAVRGCLSTTVDINMYRRWAENACQLDAWKKYLIEELESFGYHFAFKVYKSPKCDSYERHQIEISW